MQLIRGGRDLRVDFFRGLALWWIFTDHIPGDWLGNLSLRNFALCDATEVFVLLAGFAGGLVYGRALDRHGWLFAAADVLRRAWILYVAHIFLFVVFSAQVGYSAAALDRSNYLDEIHLDALADEPYRALLEALKLSFQPAFMNILPLYVVVLLIFAVALPLLRHPRVLGATSLALYAAARSGPVAFPSWTGGTWLFNPLTWQLLFMIGAITAYLPTEVRMAAARRGGRRIDAVALALVGFGLVMLWIVWAHPSLAGYLPEWLAGTLFSIDKEGLHPLRLGSILALAWLVVRLVPADAGWIRSRWAAPFTLAGQHSLPVFCAGVFLCFLGRMAMEESEGVAMQVAVNLLGGVAMAAVGALAAWYRVKGAEPVLERDNRGARAVPATSGGAP